MTADDTRDPEASGKTAAEAETPEAQMRRMALDIRLLQRKQFHQRERMLLLQQGLNQLAGAMADHPGLDYPEDLKPISFLAGSRSDVLFLSFGGVRMGAGIPPAEFHASLSGRDLPGYFIKDFRQSWYQEGLLGLSQDIAGTEAVLRALIERHSPRHVVTLGVSAGGYAAILFGALLGVDRVAAFSPQIDVDNQVLKLYSGYDTPPPKQFQAGVRTPPLRRFLRQQPKLPEISVYYGGEHAFDSSNARALDGIEQVKLKPLAGVAVHPVTVELRRTGELARILDELVSFAPGSGG